MKKLLIFAALGLIFAGCSSLGPYCSEAMEKTWDKFTQNFESKQEREFREDLIVLSGMCDVAIWATDEQAKMGLISRKNRTQIAKESAIGFLKNADSPASHKLMEMYEKNGWHQLNLKA